MKCFTLNGNIITEGFQIDNNQQAYFFNMQSFDLSPKALVGVEENIIKFAKFSKKTEYKYILAYSNDIGKALVFMRSTTQDEYYYSLVDYIECPREGLATVQTQCPYCRNQNTLNTDTGLYEHLYRGKTIVRKPIVLGVVMDGINLRYSMDNIYGRGALVLEIDDGSSFVVNREGEDYIVEYKKGQLTIVKAQGIRMLASESE